MPNNSHVRERITQINEVLKKYYENLQKKKEIALMTKMYFSPKEENPENSKYKNLIDKFVYPESNTNKGTPIYDYNSDEAKNIIKDPIGLEPAQRNRLHHQQQHQQQQQQQQDFDNTSIRDSINVSVRDLIDSVNQFNGLLDSIPANIDEHNLRDFVDGLDRFQQDHDALVGNFIDSTNGILDLLNRNIDILVPQGQDIESNIDTSINTEISNFQTSAEALYNFLNTTQYLDGNIRNIRPADYSTDFRNVLSNYTNSIDNFIKLLNEKIDIHKQQNNNAIPPDYLDTLNKFKNKFVDSKTKFINYLDSLENKGNQVFQKDASNLQRLLLTEHRNRFIASANEFLKFHENEEDKINIYKKQLERGFSSLNPQLGVSNTNLESLDDYKKMFLTKSQKFIELLNTPNKYKSQKEQSSNFSINLNIQDYLSSTENFKDLIETVNKDPNYKRTRFISNLILLLNQLQTYINTTLAIGHSQSATNNTTKQNNYISNLTKHREFFNTRNTIDNTIVSKLNIIIDILKSNNPQQLKQNTNSQQNTNSSSPKSILKKNIIELLNYLTKLEKTSTKNDEYIRKLSANLTPNITAITTASNSFQEFLTTSLSSANTITSTSSVDIQRLLDAQKEKYISYATSVNQFNALLDDELKKIQTNISSANSNANTSQILNTYQTHVQTMKTSTTTFQDFLNNSIKYLDSSAKTSQSNTSQLLDTYKTLLNDFNTSHSRFINTLNDEQTKIRKLNVDIPLVNTLIANLLPIITDITTTSNTFQEFLTTSLSSANTITSTSSVDIQRLLDAQKEKYISYATSVNQFNALLDDELKKIQTNISSANSNANTSQILNTYQTHVQTMKTSTTTFQDFLNNSIKYLDSSAKTSQSNTSQLLDTYKTLLNDFNTSHSRFINTLNDEQTKIRKLNVDIPLVNTLIANLLPIITDITTTSNTFQEFLTTSLSSANTITSTSSVDIQRLLDAQKEKYISYATSVNQFNALLDDELKKIQTNISSANSNANTSQILNTYQTHVQTMKTSTTTFQDFLNNSIKYLDSSAKTSQSNTSQLLDTYKTLLNDFNTSHSRFINTLNDEQTKIRKLNVDIPLVNTLIANLLPIITDITTTSNTFQEFLTTSLSSANTITSTSSVDIQRLLDAQKEKYISYATSVNQFNALLDDELKKIQTNISSANSNANTSQILNTYQTHVQTMKTSTTTFQDFLNNSIKYLDSSAKTSQSNTSQLLDTYKTLLNDFNTSHSRFINTLNDEQTKIRKLNVDIPLVNTLIANLLPIITDITTTSNTFQEFLTTSLNTANAINIPSSIDIQKMLETQKEKHITYINSIERFNKFLDDELKKIKSKISSSNSNANTNQILNTYQTHVQNMKTSTNDFHKFLNTSIKSYSMNIEENSQNLGAQMEKFKEFTNKFNTKTKEFEDYINKEHLRVTDILGMNDSIQEFDSSKLVPYINNIKKSVQSSKNFLDFLSNVKTDLNIINNSPSSYNNTDIFKKIGFVEYMTILEDFTKFLENEDKRIKEIRVIPKLNEINTDAMKDIIDIQRANMEEEEKLAKEKVASVMGKKFRERKIAERLEAERLEAERLKAERLKAERLAREKQAQSNFDYFLEETHDNSQRRKRTIFEPESILQPEQLTENAKGIFGNLDYTTTLIKPLGNIDKKTLYQKRMPLSAKASELFGNISK